VLNRKSPQLDPWAVLFRMTRRQEDEVIARVKDRPQEAGLVRILGGMRYRKNVGGWNEFVGRLNQMIRREVMRESLAVQEWLEEGRQEGRHEAGVQTARSALLAVIEARFPGLGLHDTIGSISDFDLLTALIPVVAKAPDEAAVLRAIRKTGKVVKHGGKAR
jgi:hypothetical protein